MLLEGLCIPSEQEKPSLPIAAIPYEHRARLVNNEGRNTPGLGAFSGKSQKLFLSLNLSRETCSAASVTNSKAFAGRGCETSAPWSHLPPKMGLT